jgi:hypothetical protein
MNAGLISKSSNFDHWLLVPCIGPQHEIAETTQTSMGEFLTSIYGGVYGMCSVYEM